MTTFLTIVHVTVCLMMVGLILIQQGKGADIGAAFGGGSHTLFGGRGATSFLTKVTVSCATIFVITSLSLAIVARNTSTNSVIDDTGAVRDVDSFFTDQVAPAEIPAAPATTDAADTPAAPATP